MAWVRAVFYERFFCESAGNLGVSAETPVTLDCLQSNRQVLICLNSLPLDLLLFCMPALLCPPNGLVVLYTAVRVFYGTFFSLLLRWR